MLGVLFFAGVGLVVSLKRIFGRRPVAGAAPAVLTRRRKLEVAEEVLGDQLPEELARELAGLRSGAATASATEALVSAQDQSEGEVDVGEVLGADAAMPAGDAPLEPSAEVRRMARHARPGLAAFLSFENIIFSLSAVLILGGTLYYAAVTWDRVPGRWQFLFLEGLIVFYGVMLVVAAIYLVRRLALESAGRVLAAVAGGVALICGLVAAASFTENGVAGLAGVVLAALFAWFAVRLLLDLSARDRQNAGAYAAAVALIGLAGGAAALGSEVAAGLCLAIAAVLSVTVMPRGPTPAPALLLGLAAAVPVAGLLLTVPDQVEIADAAPGLAALCWLGLTLRRTGRRWPGPVALIPAGLAVLLSVPLPAAMGLAAAIGCAGLVHSSGSLSLRDGDPPAGRPSLVAAIGAAVLWVFLAVEWAPAIGVLMPDSSIDWLVDLVTRPGEKVSASWDGLAALPFAVLAFFAADRLGDPRRHVAEAAGWGTIGVAALLTLATLDRQPLPSGFMLLLLAAPAFVWARHRRAAPRFAVGQLLIVAAAFCLGFAAQERHAVLVAAAAGLVLMGVGGRSGRAVGAITVPLLLIVAIDIERAPAWLLAGALTLHGGLVLWQPGRAKVGWLRPFGPPALLLALALLTLYAARGDRPLVEDELALLVLAAGVALAAGLGAARRGPRFLLIEVLVAGVGIALVGTAIAFESSPGREDALFNAGAAILALISLLTIDRGQHRRLAHAVWILAALWLPLPVARLFEATMAWPGALATIGCAAALCALSRRRASAWLAAFGLLEGLWAAWWATFYVAALLSSGGGEERLLAALGGAAALYACASLLLGERVSAAGPKLVRRLALGALTIASPLTLIGMVAVDHPRPIDIAVALGSLVSIAGLALLLAHREGRGWPIYIAEAALSAIYVYMRGRTSMLDGLAAYDAVVAAAGAFMLLGVSRVLARRRISLGVEQSRRMAALFPLLIPLVMEWQGGYGDVLAAAAGGLIYTMLARDSGKQRFGWLAALLFNLLFAPIWIRFDVESPTALFLPIGTSLMILARVYHQRLGRVAPVLRTLAAIVVLGATSIESFEFDALWPALVLAALSIGAVLLGVAWRLRAYLYTGFAFLVLDLVVNLTRWGMRDRLIAGTLGVLAGIALFALGVAVVRHKQELLQRYSKVRDWEW